MNPTFLPALPASCPVTGWGVIAAEGADARSFLHGQLSQDVSSLAASAWRLAAWCSPQGRMLASLWLLAPAPDQVLMLCPQDLIPVTVQKLSMYVLRAKCRLRDASADWQLHGHAGTPTGLPADLAAELAGYAPGSKAVAPDATGRLWLEAGGAASTLQPAALPLDLDTTPATVPLQRWLSLTPARAAAPAHDPADPALWALSSVALGWPQISLATRGHFVPQMINWELLGGVNFRKGCYPGQEVVARSQYRGTTKRRALTFAAEGTAADGAAATEWAGREVLLRTGDTLAAVGEIIQAASMSGPSGAVFGLMELQLSALDALAAGATLHLGEPAKAEGETPAQAAAPATPTPTGPALTLLQPAYALARAQD
ncbi:YgfZ/GcvT domain-containing protein [Amphibiibacter pelophylacis]|uniref:Folate-binding protein n=1 Tax=Amphibiibacter pelophylacis TaxID=1799477 RepID=A0ACC6P422_9BURK